MNRTVNATVTVLVCLADHLVHLVIGELLANRCHNVTELGSGDEAIVVTVENLDRKWVSTGFASLVTNLVTKLSQTLKASRISSSESVSFIFRAIMVRNSGCS